MKQVARMLIYAEQLTTRLEYITKVFFNDAAFTSSATEFYEYNGPKLNYSFKKFSDQEFHIQPAALLLETGIKKQPITCFEWNEVKAFFKTKGDLPFDIFSASFYLLSRYEEYLPHKKDSYGRFAHEESLAFKEGFLHIPLVNFWMLHFYELLQNKFPDFRKPASQFSFVPTYDIDIAYAVKGRGLVRKIISLIKGGSSINGKDAFDVYDWLNVLHQKHQLSPLYFFLLAKYRSKYDKNLSPKSNALKQLVKSISSKYKTGIHPSWQSHYDEQLVKDEIKSLENITKKRVADSRQHYIQFTLPHTYRSLISAGITNDHSMGYGSINGFRASYANAFYWYDLMKESETQLRIHPFCYMDANAFFEQKLSPEKSAAELQQYHDVVKTVNGQFVTIFHNHFLTEEKQWLPWRKLYEDFLATNCTDKTEITFPSLQQQL